MEKISFIVSINERDWDNLIGGWRCPALKIPSSKIDAFYSKGAKIDDRMYQIDQPNAMIIWAGKIEERPSESSLSVLLVEPLAPKKKVASWQKISVILTLVASILTASIPAVFNNWTKLFNSAETKEVSNKTQEGGEPEVIFQEELFNRMGLKAKFSKKGAGYGKDYISDVILKDIIKKEYGIKQEGGSKIFYIKFLFNETQATENNGFKIEFDKSFINSLGGNNVISNWQTINPDNKYEWTAKRFTNPLMFKKENIK